MNNLKVLHVLALSYPHVNGYTVRSQAIVETQKGRGGIQPTVITSPFYPGNPASIDDEVRDGILHVRTRHPRDEEAGFERRLWHWIDRKKKGRKKAASSGKKKRGSAGTGGKAGWRVALGERFRNRLHDLEDDLLLRRYERNIVRTARRLGIDLIHAHSPYRCGVPAVRAAKRLGIPVLYEVRGMWEESAVASGRWTREDRDYLRWQGLETEAMHGATAVVTICEQLRADVAGRGVPLDSIFVSPNAVDVESFSAEEETVTCPLAEEIREKLRSVTVGYVGSIRALEGVDELVCGAARMMRRGVDVSLLVVGGGPQLEELKELAAELGLGDRAHFPGRVEPHEVKAFYEMIDVFVVSRPDTVVTRTVTPLKPLEAMALGKPVVLSSLPSLRELGRDGETALYYPPGSPEALADCCIGLAEDPARRAALGAAARRAMIEERTWHHSLARVEKAYETVLGRKILSTPPDLSRTLDPAPRPTPSPSP